MSPDDEDEDGVHVGAEARAELLRVAERSVARGLAEGCAHEPDPSEYDGVMAAAGASFVTLQRDGALLGCIGTIDPVRPLVSDVAMNAFAAAFEDPRLPSVTAEDVEQATFKVSVLTPTEPLAVADREALTAALQPGVDGILIEAPGHRATFLPSVWEQLPTPTEFLDQLWRKAGLRPRSWPRGLQVHRYRTEEFASTPPRSTA